MKVWLLTVGEPLPFDEGNPRLLRTGLMARVLVERGHDVLWWSSTMNHTNKSQRFAKSTKISVDDKLAIRVLRGCTYESNLSFRRVLNHRGVARESLATLAGSHGQQRLRYE